MLGLREEADRRFDLVQEFLRIVSAEFKTIPGSCDGIVVHDGIVQSASRPNDGDRPIFQAVDLIQTARLIFRWHQKEVGTGFDLMGQSIVISDSDASFLRVFTSDLLEKIMIFLFSCSKKNESNIEGEELL